MLRTRVMPCLLYYNKGLYKTIKFKELNYIGDPINAIKIFNEKQVDELILLDINASVNGTGPNYKMINDIASECFMPLCYGGGISSLDQIKRIMEIGVEKVSFNTSAYKNPTLITAAAKDFGTQAVIVSIDVKKNMWNKNNVVVGRGTRSTGLNPVAYAQQMESLGAGELFLTSVDREGTWQGYDIELLKQVIDSVKIPVIVNGGAGNMQHLQDACKIAKPSGLAIGSMAVYQKKGMGVLINFPDREILESMLD